VYNAKYTEFSQNEEKQYFHATLMPNLSINQSILFTKS